MFPDFNNGWGASAVHEESQAISDAAHYAFEVSVTGFNDTEYKNNVYNNLTNGKIDGYIYRLEHIDVADNDLSALVRDGLLGELRQADLEYKDAIKNGKNRILNLPVLIQKSIWMSSSNVLISQILCSQYIYIYYPLDKLDGYDLNSVGLAWFSAGGMSNNRNNTKAEICGDYAVYRMPFGEEYFIFVDIGGHGEYVPDYSK